MEKSSPSYVFYIIIREISGKHPMVVWSEDRDNQRMQKSDCSCIPVSKSMMVLT